MLGFAPEDQARWAACQTAAAQINRDPLTLITERVEFEKDRPPGITDADIIANWHRHHPAGLDERHIPKIIEEFLQKRTFSQKYRRNIETMLERFGARFDCPLGHLTPRDIEDWLDTLRSGRRASAPISLRTRHNHRAAIENLAGFARARGYLNKDWDALNQVTDPTPPAVTVHLYTPEELQRLLAQADLTKAGRKLIPLIAITAFAGIRHGEMNEEKIQALDWANIDWEAKRIYLDAAAAKNTGRSGGDDRAVDMPDNLIAWLTPHRRPHGRICPLVNTSNALCRLRARAGIQGPKKNALRKSFITYPLALGHSIAPVAGQAGHDDCRAQYDDRGAPA